MLDTNIVSDMIRNPRGKVVRRIETIGTRGLCVSTIIAAELRYGAAKTGSQRLLKLVEEALTRLIVTPFDKPADSHYGRIRTELEAAGTPIGANDLLIGAHALALDIPLVTANAREFARIRGLSIENWLD